MTIVKISYTMCLMNSVILNINYYANKFDKVNTMFLFLFTTMKKLSVTLNIEKVWRAQKNHHIIIE